MKKRRIRGRSPKPPPAVIEPLPTAPDGSAIDLAEKIARRTSNTLLRLFNARTYKRKPAKQS